MARILDTTGNMDPGYKILIGMVVVAIIFLNPNRPQSGSVPGPDERKYGTKAKRSRTISPDDTSRLIILKVRI
jgi:hypothetical protein